MSESVTNSNGNTASNGHGQTNGHAKASGQAHNIKASHQDIGALIEQTQALRTSLRDTLIKTNQLLKGLKVHRRQSRAVQNTLASLKQLKTLGV